MSSNITSAHGEERPSWNYRRKPKGESQWQSYEQAQLEMMESARNVLEDIRRSQMLQCDVAHAIKDMAKTLRRIDRRLAKLEGAKLNRG
jgi:hypothetical protein